MLTAPPGPAAADWRRDYGDAVAGFLRGYVLDHGEASPVFGIVRRSAAERLLRAPQADRHGAWALATLTARCPATGSTPARPARPCRIGTAQPRPYLVSACQKYSTPATSMTTAQPTPASHSSLTAMSGWQYACSEGIFFTVKIAHRAAL